MGEDLRDDYLAGRRLPGFGLAFGRVRAAGRPASGMSGGALTPSCPLGGRGRAQTAAFAARQQGEAEQRRNSRPTIDLRNIHTPFGTNGADRRGGRSRSGETPGEGSEEGEPCKFSWTSLHEKHG